jgi:excisionase family DNA binding protein
VFENRPELLPSSGNTISEPADVPRLLFSQREGARVLGVSLRTIQNFIASKQLPVRRLGRRVLIHRKDLEAFARRDHCGTLGKGE